MSASTVWLCMARHRGFPHTNWPRRMRKNSYLLGGKCPIRSSMTMPQDQDVSGSQFSTLKIRIIDNPLSHEYFYSIHILNNPPAYRMRQQRNQPRVGAHHNGGTGQFAKCQAQVLHDVIAHHVGVFRQQNRQPLGPVFICPAGHIHNPYDFRLLIQRVASPKRTMPRCRVP